MEDWIFNPGSLETCSFDEAQYQRGCYLVDVAPDGSHEVRHVQNLQRPFYSLNYPVDMDATPETLLENVRGFVRQEARRIERELRARPDDGRQTPVVRLVLRGNLTFDRTRLDLEAVRAVLRDEITALLVRVENRTSPLGVDLKVDDSMDRGAIERAVFDGLVSANTEYSAHPEEWATLILQVKGLVLAGEDPAVIFALLDETMDRLEVGDNVDHETAA